MGVSVTITSLTHPANMPFLPERSCQLSTVNCQLSTDPYLAWQ
ncbi:hypothetical protein [Microcoleus sp. CAWBG58]|nr:hypothetical protein [Microcoleus sp. CAWBG58]